MNVTLSSSVFTGALVQPGRLTPAIVDVMNRSAEFQRLFALAEANRIVIRVAADGETGTFFDPPRPGRSSAVVLSSEEFTTYAAYPEILVARIGHEIAPRAGLLESVNSDWRRWID